MRPAVRNDAARANFFERGEDDAAEGGRVFDVASHLHIETAYLEQDLDVALPLRRLAELEREGIIGPAAPSHYSVQGYLLDPTEFLATSVPAIVERMKRDEGDAAVFLPV